MRITQTHICPICGIVLEGIGNHVVKKFARLQAGNALRGLVIEHNNKTSMHHKNLMFEFLHYNDQLKEFVKEDVRIDS